MKYIFHGSGISSMESWSNSHRMSWSYPFFSWWFSGDAITTLSINRNENSWFWLNESPTWQQQLWNNLTILLWFHLTPSRRRVLNLNPESFTKFLSGKALLCCVIAKMLISLSDIWTLGIQSPCQMMIGGIFSHLRNARYLGSMKKPFLRRWARILTAGVKKHGPNNHDLLLGCSGFPYTPEKKNDWNLNIIIFFQKETHLQHRHEFGVQNVNLPGCRWYDPGIFWYIYHYLPRYIHGFPRQILIFHLSLLLLVMIFGDPTIQPAEVMMDEDYVNMASLRWVGGL